MSAPAWYCVWTPEYGTVIPILDDGTGPMEYGADVLHVRATSARRAKVLAVRKWRRGNRRNWRNAQWVADAYSDGRNPFVGLKAERVPVNVPMRRGEPDPAESTE